MFTVAVIVTLQKRLGRRHAPLALRQTLLTPRPRPRPRPRSRSAPGPGLPESQSGSRTWPPPLFAGGPAWATTLSNRALFFPRLSALSPADKAFPMAMYVHLRREVYRIARLPDAVRARLLHFRHVGEHGVTEDLSDIENR